MAVMSSVQELGKMPVEVSPVADPGRGPRGPGSPFSKIITSVIYDKIRLLTEEVGKEDSYKCSSSKQFIKRKLKVFIIYKYIIQYIVYSCTFW